MIADPTTFASTINWTRPMLERFKQAWFLALLQHGGNRDETFEFGGSEWVIGYAEYLIQFLEHKLK